VHCGPLRRLYFLCFFGTKWGVLALLLAADVKESGLVKLGDGKDGKEVPAAAVEGRTALLKSENH
jgi:hypothetical protein